MTEVDLKTRIIRISGEMFFNYGVKSVSINDICAELHISKKTFYTQFAQKNDLVSEFLNRISEKKIYNHQALLESDNIVMYLLTNCKKIAEPTALQKHAALHFDLEKYYPELYNSFQKHVDQQSEQFSAEMLQCGIEQGLFRDDIDIEVMSVFMTRWCNNLLSSDTKSWSPNRKVTFLIDIFMRTVCTAKGLEYYLNYR